MKLQKPGAKTDTNYFSFLLFTDKKLEGRGKQTDLLVGLDDDLCSRTRTGELGVWDEVSWIEL